MNTILKPLDSTTVRQLFSVCALIAAVSWASNAHATMQTFTPLPTPACGSTQTSNCMQYGDFSVYSLGLLYTQATYASTGIIPTTNPNPGDPFYVASSPGELGNDGYIVYGTGTNNGKVVTNGNGTLIDDAQSQPSGVTSSFVVGTSTETAPTFTGDLTISWDGSLSAMRNEFALGSDPNGQFVIYFNLNETGNDGLDGIDLLSWFHVSLVDLDGVLASKNFYLTGNPGSTSAPNVADNNDPNWVTVHGTICASSSAGFLGYGPCDAAQKAAGGKDVNQNLGANAAAFAIYNGELSNLVLNSGYDVIRGNWQFSNINGGYEQQFSALTKVEQRQVPEPSILALFGLGLFGLGMSRRQRR